MPAYCSAFSCNNRGGSEKCIEKKISFHLFPLNDKKLLKLWLLKIRRDSFQPSAYSKLCSEHFEESCFKYETFTGRRFLKQGAVPTIFQICGTIGEIKRTSYQVGKADLAKRSSTITEKAVKKTSKMNKCFIPGCNSGYLSQRKECKKLGKKVPSLFGCSVYDDLEKWIRVIPRADRTFSIKDKICELHFDVNDIVRFNTYTLPDGSTHHMERERPLLKSGSIPTIFPYLPNYFPKKLLKKQLPVEHVPATKKIKASVKLDIERETSVHDSKADSFVLSNAQLKKNVSPLFPNSSINKSKKTFGRENPEERNIRLENEQLQNALQLSFENSTENQNHSENAVTTFLAPLDVYKQTDLTASNSVHWNKNEMTALIALFQSEKCLYDKKHKHYYDVHEKNKAYERIKTVLGNINFIFTSSQIKNKIASVYSEYASEKAYKDRCIQAEQFTEDTYAPTMWCFGLLQFLDDYMDTRTEIEIKAEAVEEENQHEIQFINSNVDHMNIKIETEETSNMEENVPLKIDSSFSLSTGFNKNLKVNSRRVGANLKISTSNKLNSIKIFSEDSEEKEDIFGEYIASEMKTLKDNPLLYMRTKQAIIDVLTSANFDLLNLK